MKTIKLTALMIIVLLMLSLSAIGCATTGNKDTSLSNENNTDATTEQSGVSNDSQRKKEVEKQQFMERLCR